MRQVSVLPARGMVYRENDCLSNGLKVCNKVQKCKVILFILCLCGEFIRPSCFPKSALIAQEAFFTWNVYSFSLGNCYRKLQSRAREMTQSGKCLPCKQKDLSSTPMTHIFFFLKKRQVWWYMLAILAQGMRGTCRFLGLTGHPVLPSW